MYYLGSWQTVAAVVGIAVFALVSLYLSRKRRAFIALQVLLLVGFLAAFGAAVLLPQKITVEEQPLGLEFTSVELPDAAHVDVELRFRRYSFAETGPYRFTVRDPANLTVFQNEGTFVRVSGSAERGWISGVIHLHFDVAVGGRYVLQIELGPDADLRDTLPLVRSTPQWLDRSVSPLLVVMSGSLLISSAFGLVLLSRNGRPTPVSGEARGELTCPECGARIPPEAQRCAACGTVLSRGATPSRPERQP
ncbi:MAG TPA: zinc ribbon domain-containing protein [Thermoplasmata archaeon]|nr:zinc ribbon domain-containing protein [Thermoplasmata archaeon]